jgi:hypothetical protein
VEKINKINNGQWSLAKATPNLNPSGVASIAGAFGGGANTRKSEDEGHAPGTYHVHYSNGSKSSLHNGKHTAISHLMVNDFLPTGTPDEYKHLHQPGSMATISTSPKSPHIDPERRSLKKEEVELAKTAPNGQWSLEKAIKPGPALDYSKMNSKPDYAAIAAKAPTIDYKNNRVIKPTAAMGKEEICEPKEELVDEHKRLVHRLKSKSPKSGEERAEEAKIQGKELKEMMSKE